MPIKMLYTKSSMRILMATFAQAAMDDLLDVQSHKQECEVVEVEVKVVVVVEDVVGVENTGFELAEDEVRANREQQCEAHLQQNEKECRAKEMDNFFRPPSSQDPNPLLEASPSPGIGAEERCRMDTFTQQQGHIITSDPPVTPR
ncbi:hypothetical protein M422DRAFT_250115 [Sphaerobolus stellatus SS14]|nr:hypothetical protein M422DRAFT_250115 [Sphaerobolus stellatus SS14]